MRLEFDVKIKKNHLFIGFVLLALVVGALAVWIQAGDEPEESDTTEVRHTIEVIDLSDREFLRTINSVGRVHSFNEAELSAEQGGVVSRIDVSVGEMVMPGRTLILLDAEDANNQLVQTESALVAERSRLEELLSGERPERLSILESAVSSAEIALSETERQTNNAVELARKNLLNNDLRAYLADPTLSAEDFRSIEPL